MRLLETRWKTVRLLGFLLLATLAALSLTGCGASGTPAAPAGPADLGKVTLKVGDQKGGSQALLKAAGLLGDVPYKIEWSTFTSGPPLLEAASAGAIDVGAVGNTPPIFSAAANAKISVVSAAQGSVAGDALLVPADSPLRSVPELRGKTIGVAKGSSAHAQILLNLRKAGMSTKDVKISFLQPADAYGAFNQHRIDAWAVWDPYTAQARLEANARVLADGTGTANGYTFQVASNAALGDAGRNAAIRDYVVRVARAQRWSDAHREQWAQAWSAETGLPPQVTLAATQEGPDLPVPLDDAVVGSEQELADAFTEDRDLPAKISPVSPTAATRPTSPPQGDDPMSVTPHWFLPTSGDGRTIVERFHANRSQGPPAHRQADIDYLAQVARAAEALGFDGVLTPTGTWCEDAWLVTAALIRETKRLKYLVAFRPGAVSPTLAAQMAATYQRISEGRLLLNVVTGGDTIEQRRFGDWHDHDLRYARTDEFLTIVRGAWSGTPFDFTGEHLSVEGATVLAPPDPVPKVYFGGSSPAALPVAARQADVYLTWGEPPGLVAEKIGKVRRLAEAEGRTVRFGIRLHTISRDTSGEAWAEAGKLLDALDPQQVAKAQAQLAASESVGQRRMVALHGGDLSKGVRGLEIHPNLWAGVGLVRGGAGTAMVGSHAEVADLIEEYHALGVEEFVLSGYPHLEEAYWFGEGVRPELARRGLLAGSPVPHRAALAAAR